MEEEGEHDAVGGEGGFVIEEEAGVTEDVGGGFFGVGGESAIAGAEQDFGEGGGVSWEGNWFCGSTARCFFGAASMLGSMFHTSRGGIPDQGAMRGGGRRRRSRRQPFSGRRHGRGRGSDGR